MAGAGESLRPAHYCSLFHDNPALGRGGTATTGASPPKKTITSCKIPGPAYRCPPDKAYAWEAGQLSGITAITSISINHCGWPSPEITRPVEIGNTPLSHLPTTWYTGSR